MNPELNAMLQEAQQADRKKAIRAKAKATVGRGAKAHIVLYKQQERQKAQLILDKPIARKVRNKAPAPVETKGRLDELHNLALGGTVFWPSALSRNANQRVNSLIQKYKHLRSKGRRFTYRSVTENNVTGFRVYRIS